MSGIRGVFVLAFGVSRPVTDTREHPPVKTIGEACRQQAQVLIQQLLLYVYDRLVQGQAAEAVFAHLFAKQRGLLPA